MDTIKVVNMSLYMVLAFEQTNKQTNRYLNYLKWPLLLDWCVTFCVGGQMNEWIVGGPFFPLQEFTYTVLFGDQAADSVSKVLTDSSILNVATPTRRQIIGEVPVKVLLNGNILDPYSNISFTFFRKLLTLHFVFWYFCYWNVLTIKWVCCYFLGLFFVCVFFSGCDSFGSSICIPQCPLQQYCGWCVTKDTCAPTSRCNSFNDLWISQCFSNSFRIKIFCFCWERFA